MIVDLSRREAVRVALAAQGFSRRRPRTVTRRHLLDVVEKVGIVQIDSVNVVTRSHYLPFLARLGPYDPALLDGLRDGRRALPAPAPGAPPRWRPARQELVEYWAHEASLVRPATWPLLGFRMRRAHSDAWGGMQAVAREQPGVVQSVHRVVRDHGPLTARETEQLLIAEQSGHAITLPPGEGDDREWGWNWSVVKNALEHLFWAGRITSAGRNQQFERRYADVGAVLAPEVLEQGPHGDRPIEDDDAFAQLMELAAQAVGVGSLQCLRDYARLKAHQAGPALQRLLDQGVVVPASVEGWRRPVYLHRDAVVPGSVGASALLSPFDSLIWERNRTAALFGFDYRLEIYTPAERRVYGYYVLPFLHREKLVARVDLKADRAAGVLRARAVHWEPGKTASALEALHDRLAEMARFLELEAIAVGAHVDRPHSPRLSYSGGRGV